MLLDKDITVLRHNLQSKPELLALLPDVMIFHKAVDWALRYNEFFNVKQIGTAKKLLELGNQRLAELKAGSPSWISATGLVPRGYISKIDGSVQPYGMVIPDDWKPGETTPRRLDFWCHGRGENLSELSFLDQRLTSKGEYTPANTLVLHLYGRFCCANKFAGETDLFEALENAKTHYNIDPHKLVVRGFSMGGGATWQFATHFAGLWAAVNPGAGFADTKEFQHLGESMDRPMPPLEGEQTLWHWYDSKDYVANLSNTTTVAYSGEIDGQKAAADIMIRSAREAAGNLNPPVAVLGKVAPGDGSPKAAEARVVGTAPDVAFYHVIAPNTPHKVIAEEKPEVDRLVDAAVAKHEALPKKVHLTTYTLRYPQMNWIVVTGMEKQWERADVVGQLDSAANRVVLSTANVTALSLAWNSDQKPFDDWSKSSVSIDGQIIRPAVQATKIGLYGNFVKRDGKWQSAEYSQPAPKTIAATAWPASAFYQERTSTSKNEPEPLQKLPGLSGPIDDAFMESFVFVRPTGKPINDKIGKWTTDEFEHAAGFWRKVFRGEAPVKEDTAISDDDIKNSNLILWGDPSSNAVLAKIIDKLPLQWSAGKLVFNGKTFDPGHSVPLMIFPNPLNPEKYVVLNSGVTFREFALLNNTDQTAKLPDWAIVDINTPANDKWPGEIKAEGFFDEHWKLPGQ
jgi:hypothetical protein